MRLGIKRSAWTAVGATLASLVLVVGCNGSAVSPSPSESTEALADYTVIATTSVFADLAQLALGNNVMIETIIPAGVDVHTFEPSPADAQKLAGADLIVMNGLGLDEWALSLLEAAGKSEEDVLELAEGIDESNAWVYLEGEEHDEEEGDGHGHGGADPHIWLDPKGAAIYVERIAARVVADLPERAIEIEGRPVERARETLRGARSRRRSRRSARSRARRARLLPHQRGYPRHLAARRAP